MALIFDTKIALNSNKEKMKNIVYIYKPENRGLEHVFSMVLSSFQEVVKCCDASSIWPHLSTQEFPQC